MTMGVWNIRGLNEPIKQKEVHYWITSPKLSLCGIVETKVQRDVLTSVLRNCLPSQWAFIDNFGTNTTARILLVGNTQELWLLHFNESDQKITAAIRMNVNSAICYVTIVYRFNSVLLRRPLWSELKKLKCTIGDQSWMIMGDFNIVRNIQERLDGIGFGATASDEFNSCLNDI
ncbi:hypothetical protein LOK49_LG13G00203 [Camellia lanceoleosa]|uniref:Uncharacterized protein n=1 Tax=Camellia lanceoleosa TaxID=1840588 RepID=A0ACC0FP15_9ERIC|nr:hypothetical protein LOK49_LG13G00203 [Camellia lanceoleosa]